jgi:hypothetical protein
MHDHAAYHSLHSMYCIYEVSHTYIFVIDHTKQEREEPPEPAPVEAGNPEQDLGKPRCM